MTDYSTLPVIILDGKPFACRRIRFEPNFPMSIVVEFAESAALTDVETFYRRIIPIRIVFKKHIVMCDALITSFGAYSDGTLYVVAAPRNLVESGGGTREVVL